MATTTRSGLSSDQAMSLRTMTSPGSLVVVVVFPDSSAGLLAGPRLLQGGPQLHRPARHHVLALVQLEKPRRPLLVRQPAADVGGPVEPLRHRHPPQDEDRLLGVR